MVTSLISSSIGGYMDSAVARCLTGLKHPIAVPMILKATNCADSDYEMRVEYHRGLDVKYRNHKEIASRPRPVFAATAYI